MTGGGLLNFKSEFNAGRFMPRGLPRIMCSAPIGVRADCLTARLISELQELSQRVELSFSHESTLTKKRDLSI